MKNKALFFIAAMSAGSILMSATGAVFAQEVRRSVEGENWNKWAMKHQKWIDEHPKKAEFFQNHPDAAQRFINNWYRTHKK